MFYANRKRPDAEVLLKSEDYHREQNYQDMEAKRARCLLPLRKKIQMNKDPASLNGYA